MAKSQTVEAVSPRVLGKTKPLRLGGGHGQCVRVVVGGKWTSDFASQPGAASVKKREFRICAVGGAGKAASLQIMTPDVRAKGEPYGTKGRSVLVGDSQKMCRFTSPGVHYEADLLPEYQGNIKELHGLGRTKRRHTKRRK